MDLLLLLEMGLVLLLKMGLALLLELDFGVVTEDEFGVLTEVSGVFRWGRGGGGGGAPYPRAKKRGGGERRRPTPAHGVQSTDARISAAHTQCMDTRTYACTYVRVAGRAVRT